MRSALEFLICAALFLAVGHCQTCVRNGAKCPDYTVVQQKEGYEERLYPSLVWVSTSAVAATRIEISGKLIKRLYGYIGGANDRAAHIDMVVPIRTAKKPAEKHFNFTMSMVVDEAYQDDPPSPTNPLLSVGREPVTTYFVRSFTGYARQDSTWDHEAELLKASLEDEDEADTTFYYRCVYDSPWREENRLNEVWYPKKTNATN